MALPTASLAGPDPATLVAALARPTPATTAYAEVRFVDLLTRPLTLRGALEYRADGGLVKRVESPYRETTTVAAGQVTVERAGKPPRRFALTRAPELGAFLESFAALLGGDAARLAQAYDSSSAGDAPQVSRTRAGSSSMPWRSRYSRAMRRRSGKLSQ